MNDYDDFDPADLDGDGEFDAIDMMIMEGEDEQNNSGKQGCSVALLLAGSALFGFFWTAGKLLS